ncbi:MAG TPA: LLM class flavin-dependent oxidoreductase [Streptosporangiaceae bacterium]|nr:LLM class flavin-dependent oxidoreductase [Streptosporangiaceae bacterium]
MTLTFHWFLPTTGDGRSIMGRGHHLPPATPPGAAGRPPQAPHIRGAAAQERPPDIEYLAQVARSAEQLGFAAVLTPTGTWCEDAWLVTAALTRETRRLKFLVAFRPGLTSPTLAAQMAATYQRLSGGRLLLNMSALAGDPGHLVRWAATAGLGTTGFLPRPAYGRYVRDLLAQTRQRAEPQSRLTELTDEVVAIRPGAGGRPLRLVLGGSTCLEADAAVLATGNLPPATPFPVPDSPRYLADPWAPGALDAARDGSPVVILGTGLTMLDVAMSVTGGDPRAVVRAMSRHGLLPQVHRGMPAPRGGQHLAAGAGRHGRPGPAHRPHLAGADGHDQPAAALAGCGRRAPAARAQPVAAADPGRSAAVPAARGPVLGSAPAPDAARHRAADYRAADGWPPPGAARADHPGDRARGTAPGAGGARGHRHRAGRGLADQRDRPGRGYRREPGSAAPGSAVPRAGSARPAPAGHRRQPGGRGTGPGRRGEQHPVHPRPDAARRALRDHRRPGDPGPGRRPWPSISSPRSRSGTAPAALLNPGGRPPGTPRSPLR